MASSGLSRRYHGHSSATNGGASGSAGWASTSELGGSRIRDALTPSPLHHVPANDDDSIYHASFWRFFRVWLLRRLNRLSAAGGVAATLHFALCFLVQLENHVLYATDGSGKPGGVLGWTLRQLFHEVEPVGVAVLLGVAVATSRGKPRWLQYLVFAVIAVLNVYVVLEQVTFKVMYQHVRLGMTDEAVSAAALWKLAGSLYTETDGVFLFNLVLLVPVTLWTALVVLQPHALHRRLAACLPWPRAVSWWASRPGCTAAVARALHCVPHDVVVRGGGAKGKPQDCSPPCGSPAGARFSTPPRPGGRLSPGGVGSASAPPSSPIVAATPGGSSHDGGDGSGNGYASRPLSPVSPSNGAPSHGKFGLRLDVPVGALLMAALYLLLTANVTACLAGFCAHDAEADTEEHPALALFRGQTAELTTGGDVAALARALASTRGGSGPADGDSPFDGKPPTPTPADPYAVFSLRAKEVVADPLKPGNVLAGAAVDAAYKVAEDNLAAFLQRSRRARGGRSPNVVLYVMESVGGKQVLRPDGSVRPSVTPVLAELQRSGTVTFPNVYANFPATVRSHIVMATGGLLATTGSVTDQLSRKYHGPTFVNQLTSRRGYKAGLFAASDLDFEGLRDLLALQNYTAFWHYGGETAEFKAEHYLNSWGGDDHTMVDLATRWAQQFQGTDQSFLLHLLPDATHHPYSTPAGYDRPFRDKDDAEDTRYTHYLNAQHYVDACLGQVVAALKEQGQWDNTVVIVTGDHGEAFGAAHGDHAKNYLHKNFLYEENMRSFLMFHDPALADANAPPIPTSTADAELQRAARLRGAAVPDEYTKALPFMAPWQPVGSPTPLGPARATVSHRVAALGDVMPSLLALAGVDVDPPSTGWFHDKGALSDYNPAQNLFAPGYQRRVVFFHKTATPLEWGLRDGVWKFIGRQAEAGVFLYNLLDDPLERVNLANRAEYADRVSAYHTMCQSWFVVTHCAYAYRLEDYPVNSLCAALNPKDATGMDGLEHMSNYREPGPKSVVAGWQDEQGEFFQLDPLQTDMNTVSFNIEWVPFAVDTDVVIVWGPVEATQGTLSSEDDPPGATAEDLKLRAQFRWKVEAGWHTTWNRFRSPAGLRPGKWELLVWQDATSAVCSQLLLSREDPSVAAPADTFTTGCFDKPLIRGEFDVVVQPSPAPVPVRVVDSVEPAV